MEMPLPEFEKEIWMSCKYYIKIHGINIQIKKQLNADELWRTTALIYVNNGQYYTVLRWTPDKEVRPKIKTIILYHALFTTQSTIVTEKTLYIIECRQIMVHNK